MTWLVFDEAHIHERHGVFQVKQGGMIPKEFYNQAEPDIKMTTASIKRGSTLHLEYQIDIPNSLLR